MSALAAAKRAVAETLLAGPAPAGEAGWAARARTDAAARLTTMGGPVRRDEYWRYTDPAGLLSPSSGGAATDAFDALDAIDLAVGEAAPRAAGLEAATLTDALRADLGFARDLFGALEKAGQEKVSRPLAALNTARGTAGFALRVTGAPPLLRLRNGAGMARTLVRVEADAAATLLETGRVGNSVMEIDIAPGATFHHVRIQEGAEAPAATHVFARLAEGASLRSFTLTADGALTRNEVVVALDGDDASAHVGGASLANGESHVDNTVFVTHGGLRGRSRQVFKNVADGRARVVFQGKIFVRPGAQKTDGYQISQAILLSQGAQFSAKPELEIYADDVVCSHGSTTGALDDEALFYLRARGVPRRAAETLLVSAFVDEAVGEIADEAVAEAVRARVAAWMARR